MTIPEGRNDDSLCYSKIIIMCTYSNHNGIVPVPSIPYLHQIQSGMNNMLNSHYSTSTTITCRNKIASWKHDRNKKANLNKTPPTSSRVKCSIAIIICFSLSYILYTTNRPTYDNSTTDGIVTKLK